VSKKKNEKNKKCSGLFLERAWCWHSFWSGVRFQFRGKSVVFFFNQLVYDLCCWQFFVLNWLISFACHFQRGDQRLDNAKPRVSISKDEFLRQLRESTFFDDEALLSLFDSLPPASASQLIGVTFDGTVLRTGKSVLDLAFLFFSSSALLAWIWMGEAIRDSIHW
jgi:hypothetical protein